MENKNDRIGPPSVNFVQMVLKTFSGAAAGVSGTMVLLLIFLLASSILRPSLSPEIGEVSTTHPLFIFLFMVMIFLSSLASSICGVVFMSMTDRERYSQLSSTLYQVFIINLVILVFALPFYLASSALGVEIAAYISGLHIVLSVIASSLVLEILGDHEYSLLGVYSVCFSILLSVGLCFVFYQMGGGSALLLLFVAFPLLWTSVGLFNGLVGLVYYWIFKNYGTDFLSARTCYGQDYGIKKSEATESGNGDVSGAEFLKRR